MTLIKSLIGMAGLLRRKMKFTLYKLLLDS